MALVRFEKVSPRIGVITLNDPDNLNAMGEPMAEEFSALVIRLAGEARQLRALILTGAGRAFSAGGDLEMLEKKRELSGEENRLRMHRFYNSFLGILKLKIPLIAAINGHAVGAGLCLASACDIRLASDKAKLGFTFTRLGLHPGMGATYFLSRVIGTGAATELLLTARLISAEEALRIGLVSKIVTGADIMSEAQKIGEEICECGPQATRQLLESIRGGPTSLSEALEREALCQAINYGSAEFTEGVRAAKTKSRADFSDA